MTRPPPMARLYNPMRQGKGNVQIRVIMEKNQVIVERNKAGDTPLELVKRLTVK